MGLTLGKMLNNRTSVEVTNPELHRERFDLER